MTRQCEISQECELPEITAVSGTKIGGRDVLVGRITEIKIQGIKVDAGDRGFFQISLDQIFPRSLTPVVCEMVTVTQHPAALSINEIVCFTVLRDGVGSRKAVTEYERNKVQKAGCRRFATVIELTRNWIYAMDAFGVEYRLNTPNTFNHLASLFGTPRLRLYSNVATGPEPLWLYPDDRIMLSALPQDTNHPFLDAQLLAQGGSSCNAPIQSSGKQANEVLKLPYDIVFVLGDEAGIEKVTLVLREEFNTTAVAFSTGATGQLTTTGAVSESKYVLVMIAAFGHTSNVANTIDEILRTYKYVDVAIATDGAIPNEYVAQCRLSLTEDRFKGVWQIASGFYGLLATIDSYDLKSSVDIESCASVSQHVGTISSANNILADADARKLAQADAVLSFLDETVNGVLKSLITACAVYPDETSAILFEIHRSGHSVQLLSAVGNEDIVQGFRTVREHLHKSPVRDLGIGGRDSDTSRGHAQENQKRFLYFLDALEGSVQKAKEDGVTSELSTLGFRINSPVAHPIWVVFLVARRAEGFHCRDILQVRTSINLAHAALSTARIATRSATDAKSLLWLGTEANDFQFFAHEAQAFVDSALASLRKRSETADTLALSDCQDVVKSLTDASAIYAQLCPERGRRTDLVWGVIDPHAIAERVINVETQKHSDFAKRIIVSYEKLDGHTLYGRPLVLLSTLRNLVSNSINQIIEYVGNSGSIRLRFVLRMQHNDVQRGNLVVLVSDDGPGIHRRYQHVIFRPGLTSRKKGRITVRPLVFRFR